MPILFTRTPNGDIVEGAGEIVAPNPAPTVSRISTPSVSLPSATPTPLEVAFEGADFQSDVPTHVTVFEGSEEDTFVPIRDSAGDQVGSVIVPDGTAGALVISGSAEVTRIEEIVSVVVDVTLISTDGTAVRKFDEDIEICLETDEDRDDVCLGFLDDDGRWECEDYCLDDSDGSLCGKTDHLTNFALLLSTVSGDRCGSESRSNVILYLSIGSIVFAIIVVIVAAIVLEARVRIKAYLLERKFRHLGRRTAEFVTE